jgi:SAM-dependent methyltransferase
MTVTLVERACPLCGTGEERAHLFAKADFDLSQVGEFAFASRKLPEYMHYRLLQCPQCELVFASPTPEQHWLESAYGEAEFDSGEEAGYAARTYAQLLKQMAPRLDANARVLDIGTGEGSFLAELQDLGFRALEGVEPSVRAAEKAPEAIRDRIRIAAFCKDDYPEGSFGLISCFQTLEHVWAPRDLVSDVYRLLAPGGAAFFIVHDYRAWSARLMGMKSPIFDIEHLQLFSARSLRYLMETLHFKKVNVRAIINKYPLKYWFRLAPLPMGIKERALRGLASSAVGRIPLAVPAGNLAVIGFK